MVFLLQILLILLTFCSSALPQDDNSMMDKERFLGKAILIEESENDLEGAIMRYVLLVNDDSTPEAIRTHAYLRLGLALQKQGKMKEALAAFEKAAKGKGEHAQRAKRLLEGTDESIQRLEGRVFNLCNTIRNGVADAVGNARHELQWIGQPSVSIIIQEMRRYGDDIQFLLNMFRVLYKIDGPTVGRFLKETARSNDFLMKRAAIRALYNYPGIGDRWREYIGPAFLVFLEDVNSQIRREALDAGGEKRIFGPVQLLSLTSSNDGYIKKGAYFFLKEFIGLAGGEKYVPQVVTHLRKMFNSPKKDMPPEVFALIAGKNFLNHPVGREFFLECLQEDGLRSIHPGWQTQAIKNQKSNKFPNFQPSPDSQALASLAETMGKRVPGQVHLSREGLAGFIELSLEDWTHEDLPAVFSMVNWGYDKGRLAKFILDHAGAKDVLWVARSFSSFDENYARKVSHWLDKQKMPVESFSSLKEWADEHLSRSSGVFRASSRSERVFEMVLEILAGIPDERAPAYLLSLIQRNPDKFYRKVVPLIIQKSGAHGFQALRELSVLVPPEDGKPNWRVDILKHLAEEGAAGVAPLVALGYWEDNLDRQGESSLLSWFFHVNPVDGSSGYSFHSLPEKDLISLIQHCLKGNSISFWEDSAILFQRFSNVQKQKYSTLIVAMAEKAETDEELSKYLDFRIPKEVFQLYCRQIQNCEDQSIRDTILRVLISEEKARVPETETLLLSILTQKEGSPHALAALKALREPNPALIQAVRAMLMDGNPAIVDQAAANLARWKDKESVELILPLLKYPHSEVRRRAIECLRILDPKNAAGWILPLMEDREAGVRLSTAQELGHLLDPQAVPSLIKALKDPDRDVRQFAQQSLEAISFYQEQTEKWRRWMEAFELGTGNAVETLLRQAKNEKDIEIRLAAITSLGTLGVPETLPFLIELMASEDPKIRATAKKAVARINAMKDPEAGK